MSNSDDFYRIDGSKVWLSPTARELAAEYFGPGRKGECEMARYLLLRDQQGPDVPEQSIDVDEAGGAPAAFGRFQYGPID